MRYRYFSSDAVLPLALAIALVTGACDREDGSAVGGDAGAATGRIRVELTDAPLDDTHVDDVYVTITGIGLAGTPLPNLTTRRTIDISNYTAGRTIQFGTDQTVPAGFHDGLTVTFDLGRDATGQEPGAYVTDGSGQKLALGYGPRTAELFVPGRFEVVGGVLNELVLDIDLREAIRRRDGGGYTLVGDAALAASMRVVDKHRAGTIEGRVTEGDGGATPPIVRIVYAFPRGAFSREAAGAEDFSQAITSGRVNAAGRFRLAYLPAGPYDLVAVDYADEDGDGRVELLGARASDAVVEAAVREVIVSAGAQTAVELTLGERL